MSESVRSIARASLDELLDVSPQVNATIIIHRHDKTAVASAPTEAADSEDDFARNCVQILDAAEQARSELGREPVTQCEIATGDAHVFVVADANHIVAAVTDDDPTVGLVFYDLKTALRAVREANGGLPSSNGSAGAQSKATSSGDDSQGRWRKKKS